MSGEIIVLMIVIFAAIFLDWLWVFKLKKREKSSQSQYAASSQAQDSKKDQKNNLASVTHALAY